MESRQHDDLEDAFVLEVKVASSLAEMAKLAAEAAEQMERMKYVTDLLREGYGKVCTYGTAFSGKTCSVWAGKVCAQADPDRLPEQDI